MAALFWVINVWVLFFLSNLTHLDKEGFNVLSYFNLTMKHFRHYKTKEQKGLFNVCELKNVILNLFVVKSIFYISTCFQNRVVTEATSILLIDAGKFFSNRTVL